MRSLDLGRCRTSVAHRAARGLSTLVVAVMVVGVVSASSRSAHAESADEAAASAQAAAVEVAAIQSEVDAARREYTTALRGVAGSISRATYAGAQADAAALAADRAATDRTAALRALTQSGGTLGMVDTVLAAESPGELAAQWQLGQQVLAVLSDQSTQVTRAAVQASEQHLGAEQRADQAVATAADVTESYERLQGLLDEQEQILAALDDRARRLAAAERAAARLAAERAAAAAAASTSASTATAGGIPKNFLALYQSAALTCSGLPWPVLAAVGQVESGHGTNNGPSSAGAQGPMQFLPSTFAAYAVDGDGDGDADIWDPADAIYSAANYLCANGAGNGPRGLYTGLWHYNHADWYVQMVVAIAGQIARRFGEPVPVADEG